MWSRTFYRGTDQIGWKGRGRDGEGRGGEGDSWRRKSAERVDPNRSEAVTGFKKGLKSAALPPTPTLHPHRRRLPQLAGC